MEESMQNVRDIPLNLHIVMSHYTILDQFLHFYLFLYQNDLYAHTTDEQMHINHIEFYALLLMLCFLRLYYASMSCSCATLFHIFLASFPNESQIKTKCNRKHATQSTSSKEV